MELGDWLPRAVGNTPLKALRARDNGPPRRALSS